MRTRTWLVVLTGVVLAAWIPAQFKDRSFGKLHLPLDRHGADVVLLGHVNGDGHPDLILGRRTPPALLLWLGDGTGAFQEAPQGQMPAIRHPVVALALGDVDGDGDLDLLVSLDAPGSSVLLLLGDGKGGFTEATSGRLPPGIDSVLSLGLADVDGDGDLDLVLGRRNKQNLLFLNDGKGFFADATASRMPADSGGALQMALGDLDGDGAVDLIFGSFLLVPRLYLNDGNGRFRDATGERLPPLLFLDKGLALGDVDGDGHLDIVYGSLNSNSASVLLNDGKGFFPDAAASGRIPPSAWPIQTLALGDLDGNASLDLVLIGTSGQKQILLNDGRGFFFEAAGSGLAGTEAPTMGIAIGDVDGDGAIDLFFANRGFQNQLFVNDGKARFRDSMPIYLPQRRETTRALVLGDVDGDGHPDLILCEDLGSTKPGPNRLYSNDGRGRFIDLTQARMPSLPSRTIGLVLGDVDGDGWPDLIASTVGRNRLLLNDGKGGFVDATQGRMPPDQGRSYALALGDVDGDGDLDLVIALSSGQNLLYLNDGKGLFIDATAIRMPAYKDATLCLALVDVDGDGDLDLVFGNLDGQNRLLLNDGKGFFTDHTAGRFPMDLSMTYAMAAGDVDGDGAIDLLFGNMGQTRLYLNDGKGRFTDATARLPVDHDTTYSVALGDVDGDRAPDLVLGNMGQNRLYLNDGRGFFMDATDRWMPPDTHTTLALVLGDLDGDGDLDLICGEEGVQDRLLMNFLTHLEAPYLARTGRTFHLEIHDAVGQPRQLSIVFPFLAPEGKITSIPPYGIWTLDSGRMVPLPLGLIAAPATKTVHALSIPRQASLIGMEFWAQAVLLRWPATAAFTRAAMDLVIP